jgi:hypothetical protein
MPVALPVLVLVVLTTVAVVCSTGSVTHVGVSVGCWFVLVEFRLCLVVFGL